MEKSKPKEFPTEHCSVSICGQCKYWAKNNPKWIKDDDLPAECEHYPCLRINHDTCFEATPKLFMLEDDEHVEKIENMKKTEDAVVQDGSGYYAALKTRESFGCVFFEQFLVR